MPVAGRMADRLGGPRLSRLAGMAVVMLPVILWRAGTLAAVIPALLAFGIAGGVLSVANNAQAVRVEEAYGRPLMASFHACYSVAALSGVVLGGLLAGRPASPLGPLAVVGVAGAAVTVVAGRYLVPGTGWPAPPRTGPASARWGRAAAGPRRSGLAGRRARDQDGPHPPQRPRPGTLGLLALCCVICEGAVGNWSGVYLHEYLGTSGWRTAAGFAGFSLAMAGGRLAGDRLAARYGRAGLVRRCALLAAAGLAGALFSRQLAVTVVGFAACGAGLSCTIPQLLSAAGHADPGRPGSGIARVTGLGYLGLVGGPPLIGGCASLVGLPGALSIPMVLVLGVAPFASRLGPRPGGGAAPPSACRPVPLTVEPWMTRRSSGTSTS